MTTSATPPVGQGKTQALPQDDDEATRVVGPDALPESLGLPASWADERTELLPRAAGPGADEATLVVTQPGTAGTTGTPRAAATGGTLPGAAVAATGATLPPGEGVAADAAVRQVGRYQIRARLGRGGMATVYRAHDPSIGRDVAIKFLHASLCEDDECRMRFLREARAAGGLSHTNIVVVHDVGEIAGRPYMAMELVDGAPLSETLDKQRRLPLRDAVVIALQLARALDYAHARGIVHRDIKPGNIMLLGDGQTIKVTDFGIAHMDDGSGEQRTVVGTVMGTPQYMSPEQTRGDKLDGRSDLFSAGVVLYQMLAGERPFRADSVVALATKIATEDPPPVTARRPEVPASLRRIVERCLAKQPAQRWQSGREMADALSKVLGELDEAAQQQGRPRIVPLRIKWAAMMSLIVALVMGATAAVITQRQYAAMMNQVSDYGASLARFIAAQNATPALGDEWETVEIAVQEIMKTRNFERVTVIDRSGLVRVSSVAGLAGRPYVPVGGEALGSVAGTAAVRYEAGGESVLGFEAPILFQDKQVGRVALGIPERPLTQVARLSIMLMIVLAAVTVLAVAVAMYFVADWLARPIRTLRDAMDEVTKGRFDVRIAEKRRDEYGQLFTAFDAMAQALQRRAEPAAPATLVTSVASVAPVADSTLSIRADPDEDAAAMPQAAMRDDAGPAAAPGPPSTSAATSPPAHQPTTPTLRMAGAQADDPAPGGGAPAPRP
ncbi:MAG: protein kinase [Burkholderiales bacterium]|nr:protein kinase [Burkholderiales bacterium]